MTSTITPAAPTGVLVRGTTGRRALWVGVGVVALGAACVASVAFGNRVVEWADILSALSGGEGIAQEAVRQRLPRTVLAVVIGAVLALAGTLLQAVTRNPLADPGILGISSGASLWVVVGITFFGLVTPASYVLVAIGGAATTAVLVYAIASLGRGGASPLTLALAGAATTAALGSVTSALLLPRIDVMDEFRFWQIGGVGGANVGRTLAALPVFVVGTLVGLGVARGLNALALGDEVAAGLGERVGTLRIVAGAAAVILSGAATALAGPIGFVGLVVPHACRQLVGVDHRWLLPTSALVGATLLTVADVVGRVVARPGEVDVGIVTALIGAPVFIWVVRRQKVRAL